METLRNLSNSIFQLGLEIEKILPGEAKNTVITLSPYAYTHLVGGRDMHGFTISVSGPFGTIKLEMQK
jgi:hypothetical protein